EYLRQGERFEGDSPDLLRRQLAWAAALLDAEENEPGRAVARLAPVFDASPDQLLSLGLDPTVGPQLVRLARDAGEPAAAAAAAAAAERLAALNPGVVSAVAAGLQARGLLDDDVDRLTAAADAFQSSPRPFGRARACEDAGEALAKAGLRDRTVGYLRQALSEYDTMGASFPAHRVRDRLHELGFPRPRGGPTTVQRPSFGWDSLTDAEVRIARLVAKGLTNRAIADRLFLSQHTVDSHLKHSFAKLGIRSRVQLTRLVLMREHKAEK
ncbi:MAG: helix-turn-helix transcriptional regulator, partial [Kineosporiaceae bacterium]